MLMDRGISKEDQGKTIQEIDAVMDKWEDNIANSQVHTQTSPIPSNSNQIYDEGSENQAEKTCDLDRPSTSGLKQINNKKTSQKFYENTKSKRGSWNSKQKKEIMLKKF